MVRKRPARAVARVEVFSVEHADQPIHHVVVVASQRLGGPLPNDRRPVAQPGDQLIEPLKKEVCRWELSHVSDNCRIVTSELGSMAGVIGAACVFRQERFGDL